MNKLMAFRKNRKGFTLVEIIVVLVILAILAAIAIPSMTGFIDEANKKALVAETRAGFIAAQSLASEEYAKAEPKYATAVTDATIKVLVAGNDTSMGTYAATVSDKGKVTSIVYTSKNTKHSCTITSAGEVSFT